MNRFKVLLAFFRLAPGLHNQCSLNTCRWSIVSDLENAQALHTKVESRANSRS